MAKWGMDIGEATQLKQLIDNEVQQIQGLVKDLDSAVAAVDWTGDDANNFKRTEWPAAKAKLQAVISTLTNNSALVAKNITQQTTASAR
jgi:hypothetical protein